MPGTVTFRWLVGKCLKDVVFMGQHIGAKILRLLASPWAQQRVDVGIRKAFRGPFLKGRFEGFTVVLLVACPEEITVSPGQGAGAVCLPKQSELEVPDKMVGVNWP